MKYNVLVESGGFQRVKCKFYKFNDFPGLETHIIKFCDFPALEITL